MGARAARVNDEDLGGTFAAKLPFPVRWLLLRPRDSIATLAAGCAVVTILVNALFMQSGPHPAPIFSTKPAPVVAPLTDSVSTLLPGRKPVAAPPPAKPKSDTVVEIQRELSKRGFYEGPADGYYGPKTDAAIRDFEQSAGLRPSAEPTETLLAAITRSSIKAKPQEPARDPIAALLAPNGRITAVQRALTEFGYGPVGATGAYDAQTKAAIERFEKARKRQVTGQINDQLVRDLAALTGRPLE